MQVKRYLDYWIRSGLPRTATSENHDGQVTKGNCNGNGKTFAFPVVSIRTARHFINNVTEGVRVLQKGTAFNCNRPSQLQLFLTHFAIEHPSTYNGDERRSAIFSFIAVQWSRLFLTGGTYKRSQQIVSLRGLQVLPVKLYADGLIMILQGKRRSCRCRCSCLWYLVYSSLTWQCVAGLSESSSPDVSLSALVNN